MGNRTKNDLKRAKWFSFGVEAFQRARPGAPAVYACPLCVRGFASIDALTLEHVPPKSIGGRQLVLTCRECNNTSGSRLDSHIRAGRDLQEIAAGERTAAVGLKAFGHAINARATFPPDSILLTGVPEKSNPDAHRAFFEGLDAASASGSSDWSINLEFSTRHSERREGVGWLRAAYLYVFAALGYDFVMRPELNIPDYQRSSDFYERLDGFRGVGQKLTMMGTSLDLPRRPQFAFDYHPMSRLATFPPAERGRATRGV